MTQNFEHDANLEDVLVLRYIDGDRSAEVLEALGRMPDAAQRIADLGGLHNRLASNFYRAACVDTLTLADYVANLLSPEKRQQVAAHVVDCARCLPEVETMRGAYREVDIPAVTAGAKVRRLLHAAKLALGSAGGFAAQPAFAVRDAATAEAPLLYTIGDEIEISLNLRPGTHNLFAQVSDFGTQPEQWAGAMVRVVTHDTGRLVATTATDPYGTFEISGLTPGSYGMTISGTNADLVVDDVQV